MVRNNNLPSEFQTAAEGCPEQDIHKVCMFVVHEGELLCVVREHKDGSASVEPPGGKIDTKPCGTRETVEEALRREASEELNIEVNPLGLVGVEPHPHSGKPVGYYACEYVGGEPVNNLEDEHLGILRVPLADLPALKEECARETWGGQPVGYRIPDNLLQKAFRILDSKIGSAVGTHYRFG